MAIRLIRQEGDEILKKTSKKVEELTDKDQELIRDMLETLHKNNGVGLAAVQVGVLKRIIVIDIYQEGVAPFILINPEIISTKGLIILDEGCLSFPNKFAKMERPEEVTIKALNEKLEKIKLTGKELLAQALAHEIDHLNGIVFVDKMIPGTLEVVTDEEKEEKKEKRQELFKQKEEDKKGSE